MQIMHNLVFATSEGMVKSWYCLYDMALTLSTWDVQRYTEALVLAPDWPVLLVNRAMCQKHRGRWGDVESDSRRALDLDSRNMKV